MFQTNEVVSLDGHEYRILSCLTGEYIWISIEDASAFPELIRQHELVQAIDEERLLRCEDPFASLAMIQPEDGTTAKLKRDKNMAVISSIVSHPEYYDRRIRGRLIGEAMQKHGFTKQTLYRLLRRYWQRGQMPNALLPDYHNSGAKGKKRHAKDKKLGRPRVYKPGIGANMDASVERLFRIAIDKYLLKERNASVPYAYRRFQSIYTTHNPHVPEEEIPSIWQMKHFYKREYSTIEKLQKRNNKNNYRNDVRPLTSTATTQAMGPGSRYEIDATIADIYLVSTRDKSAIVGRPTVYAVVDVFSRLITGVYIGFENPSYAVAMQALVNSMTSKVDYCKSIGFDISDEQWPALGLPDAILADRGELLGHQIESLESSFSVRIENTPPHQGSAKGIVERHFKWVQADFKPFAPGVVTGTKVKKRGGKDYRLDAALTVQDFTEIIVSSVLMHNQFAVLKKYDRAPDMPTDLEMTPLSIWNWGIQNRTGRLRQASEAALRVAMMPRVKVSTSELGVCAFGLYYTCSEMLESGWLHRDSSVKRPESLLAAYDPNSADHIYLFTKNGSLEHWVCKLSDHSREYQGCSFWDVWRQQAKQKSSMAKQLLVDDKQRRDHESFVQQKIKQAVANKPNHQGLTKAERIATIRSNREQEKQQERQGAAYSPTNTSQVKAPVTPLRAEQEDDCTYPDFIDELFDDHED
ncbi:MULTISPECIES: Mu transposase C-terminal domain-containing protein [Aliagarivorans]|uniref:Mu transposase C-terminal domain-containing protein n=1 Tax=Aliagarivorans TaxID=882379 RepID=UPI00041D11B5|nr:MULTISPECIES: Mu transposase C-terminal domain-containing protein [Aliagarivorans]